MTFTIIGISKKNKELGIACFSKAFAIGGVVPAIDLNIGAIATQSYPNVSYKKEGLKLMKKNNPEKIISILTKKDRDKDIRQIILMNKQGKSAAFTGNKNVSWAGSLIGKNCICAGNMLVGEEVLKKMVKTFENSKGNLNERLIKALKAGEKCGGDKRKRKYNSSSLIIEKYKRGILNIGNRYIDLRVDYSPDSIKDLSNLCKTRIKLNRTYLKKKNK
jgi:uncharacterized Ntn-hydrolase superfamily protein